MYTRTLQLLLMCSIAVSKENLKSIWDAAARQVTCAADLRRQHTHNKRSRRHTIGQHTPVHEKAAFVFSVKKKTAQRTCIIKKWRQPILQVPYFSTVLGSAVIHTQGKSKDTYSEGDKRIMVPRTIIEQLLTAAVAFWLIYMIRVVLSPFLQCSCEMFLLLQNHCFICTVYHFECIN